MVADLEIHKSYKWTIMSDKQKRLVDALNTLLPDVEHRFCIIRLYNNFKSSYKGLRLKELLWRATLATRIVDFNAAMDELKKVNKAAQGYPNIRPGLIQWKSET